MEFCKFELVQVSNFSLDLQFWFFGTDNLIFWTEFAQKEYIRSKTGNVKITIEFCTFQLV